MWRYCYNCDKVPSGSKQSCSAMIRIIHDLILLTSGAKEHLVFGKKDARSLYIEGLSKEEHRWEKEDKYLKSSIILFGKRFQDQAAGSGHGSMDFFIFRAFIEALKGAKPVIDVYDAVSMSVISPLSEKSIGSGSASVKIPDFTRGKWKKINQSLD